MADDVDTEAEHAAQAARAAVKRSRERNTGSFVPVLLVIFALLTVGFLIMTDESATTPGTAPRADTPITTQPAN